MGDAAAVCAFDECVAGSPHDPKNTTDPAMKVTRASVPMLDLIAETR
jgi:hypothetical protein